LFFGPLEAIGSLALFFYLLCLGGLSFGSVLDTSSATYRSATGITLASIVLMQIANLLGRRSRHRSGIDWGLLSNPLILAGIGIEVAFSWAILYWPPVQSVLGTGPVPLHVYGLAWLCVPVVFSLDYAQKTIARRMWIKPIHAAHAVQFRDEVRHLPTLIQR
jgi:sodium/potassium-transporting ATPase subunit alpha